MRKLIAVGLLVMSICLGWNLPSKAGEEPPHWTTSIRFGYWKPAIDGWQQNYGHNGLWTFGLEQGYKLTRQLTVDLSLNYAEDTGTGITVTGRPTADEVTFRQWPLHLSLLYRLAFRDDQILVPYVGGGYSYLYYRQEFGNEKIDGDRQGFHGRVGLQILLDAIEPRLANDIEKNWGVRHSYFTMEALHTTLDNFGSQDVDLGGTAFFGSIMFEY